MSIGIYGAVRTIYRLIRRDHHQHQQLQFVALLQKTYGLIREDHHQHQQLQFVAEDLRTELSKEIK